MSEAHTQHPYYQWLLPWRVHRHKVVCGENAMFAPESS
jgi:hypothetical protein